MNRELASLAAILIIAAFVPLIVGLFRLKVAEVVLLLGAGIIAGPEVLGFIEVDGAIDLLSELGLGMLFFLAGLELEQRAIRGRSGKLAASGWFLSLATAVLLAILMFERGTIHDVVGVAIALSSTAMGTLLPVLRDRGELGTKFGTFFMGAGAWGEFGPIIAIAVLLGTKSSFAAIISLAIFAVIAFVLAFVSSRIANDRIKEILERGHGTSSQTAVRFSVLLVVILLTVASVFGLDAVLGAFIAGVIVRRFAPPSEESKLSVRIESIGFGFFIPIFFVVSGANLDILSIVDNPLPMIRFFIYMFIARGLVQFFLYRKAFPNVRERMRFSLYVATGLPIIVAVTSIEVASGAMSSSTAASLVGAGALTVLVFPLVGNFLVRNHPAGEITSARG
ncbi:MAG: cation:proton antiporter [Candidatus Nanopelagicales bacterium]|nr:cation:proton antiporter [Candidatus Nanopelagicales bacterium]